MFIPFQVIGSTHQKNLAGSYKGSKTGVLGTKYLYTRTSR
jgi:hypothetical protein